MAKTITTRYQLNILPAGSKPIRAALVADLHDRDCTQALSILKQEKPDLIFIAGDLMERHEEGAIQADGTRSPWTFETMEQWMETPKNRLRLIRFIKHLDGSASPASDKAISVRKISASEISASEISDEESGKKTEKWDKENGYRFLREASRIAPIYYSIGNHEWYHTAEDVQILKECGVSVLDNRDELIFPRQEPAIDEKTENGKNDGKRKTVLRIGGLSTRHDKTWLAEYARKDGIKILLLHHPDYYKRMVQAVDDFDLILSGHVHGGQWRIFGQGIFAPGQGFFPKLHHGFYETVHSRSTGRGGMIISAGCANTTWIPRWGNPCEVVMLELKSRNQTAGIKQSEAKSRNKKTELNSRD